MFILFFKRFILTTLTLFFFISNSFSEIINKIEISGNDRIPTETIKIFSKISINDEVDDNKLNEILKNLYDTNYFSLINLSLKNNILKIDVVEYPIVYNVVFAGIKSESLKKTLKTQLQLKERTPLNEILLVLDKINIKSLI